ncbi:hypothetical protein Tco_0737324 [Tanacetum coccineum]
MAIQKHLGVGGSPSNLKKLDRILVREDVMKQFVKASRFANYVADKKDFSNEVRKGWKDEVQDQLKSAQCVVDKDLKEKATRLLHECNIATEDELRAKIKWLREGDKNTSFFHGTLKDREHKNRVETVCAEVGTRYVGDEVSGKFVDHFQRFIDKESLKVVKKTLDDFSKGPVPSAAKPVPLCCWNRPCRFFSSRFCRLRCLALDFSDVLCGVSLYDPVFKNYYLLFKHRFMILNVLISRVVIDFVVVVVAAAVKAVGITGGTGDCCPSCDCFLSRFAVVINVVVVVDVVVVSAVKVVGVTGYTQMDLDYAAGGNLKGLNAEEAWETIEDCVQYDKQWNNPTSTISNQTIANFKAQLVGNEVVRGKIPKCMSWLDDEPIGDLDMMEDKVDNPSPPSTPQVFPSFGVYTPPVTYLEEVDETIGIPIEVKPLDHMKLEDLGLNTCNHDLVLSSKGVLSVDEPEPQP